MNWSAGCERKGAEQSGLLATQKAENSPLAWFPSFMYSSVCFDNRVAHQSLDTTSEHHQSVGQRIFNGHVAAS